MLTLGKAKGYNIKMKNNNFKKVCIKISTWYYFNDIIKLEDFDLDNILIDKQYTKNILTYGISYKTLIVSKHLQITFDKIDGIIRINDGTRYLTWFGPKIMTLLTTELDIL